MTEALTNGHCENSQDGWSRPSAKSSRTGVCSPSWKPSVPSHLYERLPQHHLASSEGSAEPKPLYLPLILTSSVYSLPNLPTPSGTPLTPAINLSKRLGCKVLLKRENLMGGIFSFKCRGAWNFMKNSLSEEERWKGVVACSAGNHAQGVALSCRSLSISSTIVMPLGTPSIKYLTVESLGSKVVLHGNDFDAAKAECARLQKLHGLRNVPPYDDPHVIAGAGTVGMEILRQTDAGDLDAIFVAVGGGGLLAGVCAYVKAVAPPGVKVIGVETYDGDALSRSLWKGERVTLEEVGLFSDGTAVKVVGEETFRICAEEGGVDEVVLVTNDEICAAIKDAFEDTRSVPEPAGAVALAGMKKYIYTNQLLHSEKKFVAIISGANMNFSRLRFVADRAEMGEKKEVLLSVVIPEKPGSFLKLCRHVHPRPVTEFIYRYSSARRATIFISFTISLRAPPTTDQTPQATATLTPDDLRAQQVAAIMTGMRADGFKARDITDNEMAKSHARFLIGGSGPKGGMPERIFSFSFPERPGSLEAFLEGLRFGWNISLFHYRNHGGDMGKVLAGIQVPREENGLLDEYLLKLNYPFVEETDNPVYKEFLGDTEWESLTDGDGDAKANGV
ncbi:threonine dehydratase I [Atractiella rhizophila]|nr:threonine dehydratase I [Atractiella rhizophila]